MKKKKPHSRKYIFFKQRCLRHIISSTQFIWIIRLSTLVLLFMPWFYTDNHFAANPPWSQTDINMLQTCNPLQIAKRGCKMILWGHRSLYLVSTLPLQASPPLSISGKLLYMGVYGTERLGYSLNYLCKVNSLYAFETQFEGLVPTFSSRIVIHKGYYKRPLSYRNTCSKRWDCRVAPADQHLFYYKTAYLLTDTLSFKWCTSVSQPFIGLSCSSFKRLVPTPTPTQVRKRETLLLWKIWLLRIATRKE